MTKRIAVVDAAEDAQPPAPEGLRERKRRATRAAIEKAALTLVDELGYEGVTVAMMCERAMVSQGTFFNYFSTKDAAVVGVAPADLDDSAIHATYDKLATLTPYQATLSIFLTVVRGLDWTSETASLRMRLIAQRSELMRLFLDNAFGFVVGFRDILAAYLAQHPERRTCVKDLSAAEEAGLVVAEALSAARFALERAAADPRRQPPEAEDIERLVKRIVD